MDRARLGGSLIGPASLIQTPDDLFDWESIEADKERIYLLKLSSPGRFYDLCPPHWQRPTQLAPDNGIPKHVWLGCDFEGPFDALLELWPVKRFVYINAAAECTTEKDLDLLESALSPVRCSNCGKRYDLPVKRCAHLQLCGESKILPQLEVWTGEDWAKDRVEQLGGKWLSWE